jgi:transposase
MLAEADQRLHARYDKVELPPMRPVVTRVERYGACCPCCGGTTLALVHVQVSYCASGGRREQR